MFLAITDKFKCQLCIFRLSLSIWKNFFMPTELPLWRQPHSTWWRMKLKWVNVNSNTSLKKKQVFISQQSPNVPLYWKYFRVYWWSCSRSLLKLKMFSSQVVSSRELEISISKIRSISLVWSSDKAVLYFISKFCEQFVGIFFIPSWKRSQHFYQGIFP